MTIYAVNGKEPIGAWIPSLDGTGNGTGTLYDLVGSVNATINSGSWESDTNAGGVRCVRFNGSSTYLSFPSAAYSFSSTASISLWLKLDSATPAIGENTGVIQTSASGGNSHYPFTNGLLYFNTFRSSRVDAISPSGSIGRDGWHLLVITTDATNWKLWQNTTNTHSTTADASVTFSNANFKVGGSNDGTFVYFDGVMDDIRLWDVALNSSDISYLYNSGSGRGVTASSPIAAEKSAVHMMMGMV